MILQKYNVKTINVLHIAYDDYGFLLPQQQISFSKFFNQFKSVSSPSRYLNSLVTYNDEYILVFDLDQYIREIFKCKQDESNKLILIAATEKLNEDNKKFFSKIKFIGNTKLSKLHFGLKANVDSELTSVELSDLKLLSSSIKQKFIQKGILACRFNNDKIDFLFDIDSLLQVMIKDKRKQ